MNITLLALILMVGLSFSNLFGLKYAGLAVLIGIVFFFINKAQRKQPFEGSGLDFRAIKTDLREKRIWFWIALPLIMDAVSITLAKLFLPEFIDHVLARTENFVSFNVVILTIAQLAVLALGEEIAWRAFFQKQVTRFLPILPTLLISSALFAIGHFNQGDPVVVLYDVFFVFINSLLYGAIFYKTNNAWISAIAHFAANLFSAIVLVYL